MSSAKHKVRVFIQASQTVEIEVERPVGEGFEWLTDEEEEQALAEFEEYAATYKVRDAYGVTDE